MASLLPPDYARRFDDLPGWFERIDALLFVAADAASREACGAGDLLEIGAYLGKSTVLMGYFVRHGERLHVCDTFGISDEAVDTPLWYDRIDQRQFERNFQHFHINVDLQLHRKLSQDLDRGDFARPVRFVHIDGSHAYEAVRQDIAFILDIIMPPTVVVFDDYREVHTPGVAAAVWEALLARSLRVLARSEKKLYAVPADGPDLLPALRDALAPADVRLEEERILGSPSLWVRWPEPSMARKRLAALRPPGVDSVRRRLRSGAFGPHV